MSQLERYSGSHRDKLLSRVRKALQDLYHNATPNYPTAKNEFEEKRFSAWFEDAARSEIDYIQSGGAYQDLASTCRFIRTQYKSDAAGNYAERRYRAQARHERATPNAAWELISEFGQLYQYGRGGRTLAPKELMERCGASERVNQDYFKDANAETITRAILILESFNEYVRDWNRNLPSIWQDHKSDNDLDDRILAYEATKRICDAVGVAVEL